MTDIAQEGTADRGTVVRDDLETVLNSSLELIKDLESCSDTFTELEQLKARLESGAFRLAILGQFKRGKSTLLNALLGEDLLPSDILPVTAIPTYISYSARVFARVCFLDKPPLEFPEQDGQTLASFLNRFVTEGGNPDNQLQVERVEIGHPADFLSQGVVLIDTPGVGSTFRHNTEVAFRVLAQCDAALFLVSPDPPITENEIDYLRQIRQKLPKTFFVLNKIDLFSPSQIKASVDFLVQQLEVVVDVVPKVLSLSALQGLKARQDHDSDLWRQSGMELFRSDLIDFLVRDKQDVLHQSLRLRLIDQLSQLQLQLQLQLKAIMLPEQDLKQKISEFQNYLPLFEREKLATADVLAGDVKRIKNQLTAEVENVWSLAKERLLKPLEEFYLAIGDTEEMERRVRESLNDHFALFFAREMKRVATIIHRSAEDLLHIHQQRCNRILGDLRKTAAEIFQIPYQAPVTGQVLVSFDPPGWSDDLFISDMDPLGQRLARKLFRKSFRHKRTVKRLREESLRLVGQNVEQINWALSQGVAESFRKYNQQLTEQLDKALEAIHQAMQIALQKKDGLSIHAAPKIGQLSAACKELEHLLQILNSADSIQS